MATSEPFSGGGQSYGGVEPYAVAALFGIDGQSAFTLHWTPVLLSVVAALLVWRCALRLVADRRLAILAGALAWVAPYPFVEQSTFEGGFREVVLICGLALLLMALRVLDGHRRYGDLAAFGIFAGVGWWASPEIVYFFIPALIRCLRWVGGTRERLSFKMRGIVLAGRGRTPSSNG